MKKLILVLFFIFLMVPVAVLATSTDDTEPFWGLLPLENWSDLLDLELEHASCIGQRPFLR